MDRSRVLELAGKQITKLVKLHQEIAAEMAARDEEQQRIAERFEKQTAAERAAYEETVTQLEAFAIDYRDQLFEKGKKSVEISGVTLGFRFGQPVIMLGGQPADKEKLLNRLHERIEETEGIERKLYQQCIEIKEVVSLSKLKKLPEEQFDGLKVKLVQQEKFYVDVPAG